MEYKEGVVVFIAGLIAILVLVITGIWMNAHVSCEFAWLPALPAIFLCFLFSLTGLIVMFRNRVHK